jgi:hypothetical protein
MDPYRYQWLVDRLWVQHYAASLRESMRTLKLWYVRG